MKLITKTVVALTCFLFSLAGLANDIRDTCNPVGTQLRATKLIEQLESYDSSAEKPSTHIYNIIADREILPERGVLAVMGPGSNLIELIAPLLLRPDATIIVFEREAAFFPIYTSLAYKWEKIQRAFPDLVEASPSINSETAFNRALAKVLMVEDVRSSSFLDPVTGEFEIIPTPDLAIARSPFGELQHHFNSQLGEKTLAWIVTELKETMTQIDRKKHAVTPLNSAIGLYFGEDVYQGASVNEGLRGDFVKPTDFSESRGYVIHRNPLATDTQN